MIARPELEVRAERATAARRLLRSPWITREADPEIFGLIVIHRAWLADRFDQFCGWPLQVDVGSGTARLHKRVAAVDPSRSLQRPSDGRPFDRRRHALWATVCAELLARPLQSIADLADVLEDLHADPGLIDFDTGVRAHRLALVDVLHWLLDRGIIADPVGDLAEYAAEGADVVLHADQTRLAMLLSAPRPPARMPQQVGLDPSGAVAWLTTEPRYGTWGDAETRPPTVPAGESRPDADARNLYARHMLARRLLDDPAVELDGVHPAVARYAGSQQGRARTAEIADFLDMAVEHHADVLLLVDETGQATDSAPFDRPAAHVNQAGAVVLSGILDGTISTVEQAREAIAALLAADTGWAAGKQDRPDSFTEEVLDVLSRHWLVRRDASRVAPRPGAHRLRICVQDTRDPTPSPDQPDDNHRSSSTTAEPLTFTDLEVNRP